MANEILKQVRMPEAMVKEIERRVKLEKSSNFSHFVRNAIRQYFESDETNLKIKDLYHEICHVITYLEMIRDHEPAGWDTDKEKTHDILIEFYDKIRLSPHFSEPELPSDFDDL